MSSDRKPKPITAEQVICDLLEELEDDGNCPGSPIRHRGEEVWLHTTGQVGGWIRNYADQAGIEVGDV